MVIEGYGRFNPLWAFIKLKINYYNRIVGHIKKLEEDIQKLKQELDNLELSSSSKEKLNRKEKLNEKRMKRMKLMHERVERFPDDVQWLLPTSLGNIMRGFECYSRVMYGLESTQGWGRLLAVIPTDYRNLIDEARSDLDFWINVFFLSLVFLLEYLVMVLRETYPLYNQTKVMCIGFYSKIILLWESIRLKWILFPLIGIIIFSHFRAKKSALEWGNFVKSSFDLFLPELAKKMNFTIPQNRHEEKLLWQNFSQSIIYHLPDKMPDRQGPAAQSKQEED